MERRFKMKAGKQRMLIRLAKKEIGTWKELSSFLSCNESYLKNELRNEKITLSSEIYEKLCDIAGKNFDDFILEKLDENWGRKKGAKRSPRTKIKNVGMIEPSEKFAEIIGIMLGDGNIYKNQYAVRICGHIKKDREYLLSVVKPLFKDVFGIEMKEYYHERVSELILYAYSKFVVYNLENYGLVSGNKKINSSKIPEWILGNEKYTIACVRGLFDTDGCVFIRNGKLKFELYSAIKGLRDSFIVAMENLGFKKKWRRTDREVKTYGIYSSEDVKRFINIINFNNPKHKVKCLDGVVA